MADRQQEEDKESGQERTLTPFDVTSLVVGAVVGANIYVVASLGATLIGPAMLIAWAIAGVMAVFIALSFAQCAAVVPRAGGPYAYARAAFGDLAGFLIGWSLFLAETVTISVFPVALVRYLRFFAPEMNWWHDVLAKFALIAFLTVTNYFGARVVGKVNDALAIAKLGPLLLLVLLGIVLVLVNPRSVMANVIPFAPLGWSSLGSAIILAFWAYGGFELAVLPAAEIVDPRRTLPTAIVQGMAIITVFYLLVNAVAVLAMPWYQLSDNPAPLAAVMMSIMQNLSLAWAGVGGILMALGAIISITGANESATLGTSRLSYAMAADGYFPRAFALLHPRYGTPYWGLIFLAVFALAASLIGSITSLISLAVFFLSFTYVGTILAALRLTIRVPRRKLRFAGSHLVLFLALLSAIYIMSQTTMTTLLFGIVGIIAGLPIYLYFAPRTHLKEVQRRFLAEPWPLSIVERIFWQWPLYLFRQIGGVLKRLTSVLRQ